MAPVNGILLRFYQPFPDRFDIYVRTWEERLEPRSGPLRPVVEELWKELMCDFQG